VTDELALLFESGPARVAVIGLGYVGLPLARSLTAAGLQVVGFDVDPEQVEAAGFEATVDFTRLAEADAVLVCVPTPLGAHNEPDLSHVEQAAAACGRSLRAGQLFVLESTTYPRTTRDEFLGALRRAHDGDLRPGSDFFVAYSPEREDPGRTDPPRRAVPKLVGGLDPRSGALAAALYRRAFDQVIEVSSAEVAEAAKLLENVFRSVNIALVNELKLILDAMDLDVWEVIDAAATKPFGFMRFDPGPGLGGHCIPIDPFYLAWKARELGRPTRFVELAGETNAAMPAHVVQRTCLALNEAGCAPSGARVLVLGLAYKPDVADTRESPSLELIAQLRALGAEVAYHDPHVPHAPAGPAGELESVELTAAGLAACDAVLVATDHGVVDYQLIARHARLVIDTRNAFARRGIECAGRLLKA
jgi:UDP-N-acetyl-D-glucosamine dehydrogenase